MSITLVRTVPLSEGLQVTLMRPGAEFEPVTVARLVGDTWAVVTPLGDDADWYVKRAELVTHADYPHNPGYLEDCYACLATCHCADATCVSCGEEIGYAEAEEGEYQGDVERETDLTWGFPGE